MKDWIKGFIQFIVCTLALLGLMLVIFLIQDSNSIKPQKYTQQQFDSVRTWYATKYYQDSSKLFFLPLNSRILNHVKL